ncbi:MAG: hypothetical protein COV29_03150 [Candidatus Yanofskybacteria bacterium CG10_big_fil_rev_8_21_14_0_10_36_16]|uniref:Neutral/alkaline non-lysosomal ceramidase N-terminal domain-containing protein n=1 Tax=Candidatus Yanofskybacteria bacterium CG10_big_fil_rev_8_21_14_0_10_36_16 TaxID=1975096 RepID=A0A2J0QAK0_9BACT|nr:MAG: hypothetical protein COV29_03150 [Candidatus Yanofskybacteria bacterium CG10_big_fil_rev_8_21_14_0_10_36_16]
MRYPTLKNWFTILIFILGLICLLGLIFSIRASSAVRVGYDQRDITPTLGLKEENPFLPGKPYNKRANNFQDELTVSALVLDDGFGNILALVSVDAFGLFRDDVQKIRQRVRDIFPDGNKIIVSSTHTHSAPDFLGVYSDSRKDKGQMEDLEYLINQTADAIRSAYKNRNTAEIKIKNGRLGDIIANDRDPNVLDDNVFMMHIQPTKKYFGIIHGVADFFEAKEKPIFLVGFACHPEFLRKTDSLSSDYVGNLRDRLSSLGKNETTVAYPMFFSGALGGMVVPNLRYRFDDKLLGMIRFNNDVQEQIYSYAGTFEAVNISPMEIRTEILKIELKNKVFKNKLEKGLLPHQLDRGKLSTEVSVVFLGDQIVLVAVPGEMSPEISLKIRTIFPDKTVWFLGLANDELGYILPKKKYKEKIYEYERSLAVNDNIGDEIFKSVKRMARK